MPRSITRRALGGGLFALTLRPVQAPAFTPDPILALIEAHREAVEACASAVLAFKQAERRGDPDLADLRAERDRSRKLRHGARRNLRRATPETLTGFAALGIYYGGLVPSPDPQDVAGTCHTDLAAAYARMIGRAGR